MAASQVLYILYLRSSRVDDPLVGKADQVVLAHRNI